MITFAKFITGIEFECACCEKQQKGAYIEVSNDYEYMGWYCEDCVSKLYEALQEDTKIQGEITINDESEKQKIGWNVKYNTIFFGNLDNVYGSAINTIVKYVDDIESIDEDKDLNGNICVIIDKEMSHVYIHGMYLIPLSTFTSKQQRNLSLCLDLIRNDARLLNFVLWLYRLGKKIRSSKVYRVCSYIPHPIKAYEHYKMGWL